jgi:hypothetical protein
LSTIVSFTDKACFAASSVARRKKRKGGSDPHRSKGRSPRGIDPHLTKGEEVEIQRERSPRGSDPHLSKGDVQTTKTKQPKTCNRTTGGNFKI